MNNLITRLERADGPDRELDCRIWCAIAAHCRDFDLFSKVVPDLNQWQAPRYTTSIDAALTLVPEGLAAAVLLDAINANQEAENWLYHLPRYIVIAALRALQKDTNA